MSALFTPSLVPVGQQVAAVEDVIRWCKSPGGPRVYRFFGFAGTGKTSLATHIVERLELGPWAVRYAAFSGKAADVLRRKGCAGASTVHSLIYHPVDRDGTVLAALRAERDATPAEMSGRIEQLDGQIAREKAAVSTPGFVLRDREELAGVALIVLDEVSMLGDRIVEDLLSFGIPVLCLGDPEQLPPIHGEGALTRDAPDTLLTELHRSAWDSPVTTIATSVRCSPVGDRQLGVYGQLGDSGRRHDVTRYHLPWFDQVMCWRNATRWALIARIRAALGRPPGDPVPGDRVMALVNSTDAGVLNGQQFEVLDVGASRFGPSRLALRVRDEDDRERVMVAWRSGFQNRAGEDDAKTAGRGEIVAATFANAITVHKAQGSQWRNVLVVDESGGVSGMTFKQHRDRIGAAAANEAAHIMARRWLYTAATRASDSVMLVDPAQVA